MQLQYESIQTGESYPSVKAYLRKVKRFDPYWHYHPQYELTYIRKGRGLRYVGDHVAPFTSGEVVLLGPNLPHQWISEERKDSGFSEAVVAHFSDLSRFKLAELAPLGNLLREANHGVRFFPRDKDLMGRLDRLFEQKPLRQFTQILEILDRLNEEPEKTTLSSIEFRENLQHEKNVSRITEIKSYLLGNLEKPISVEMVSHRCSLTVPSFCRWFKQSFDASFITYLNQMRIERACQLLLRTDESISQIAYQTGFDSISNFNRFFKRFKDQSPRDYRGQRPALLDR